MKTQCMKKHWVFFREEGEAGRLRLFPFVPVINRRPGSMLKRADRHQRIDFGPGKDQFDFRRSALLLISVSTFNYSMAYPLNAKFICRGVGSHPKTTMLERHKSSRHITNCRVLNGRAEDSEKRSTVARLSASSLLARKLPAS